MIIKVNLKKIEAPREILGELFFICDNDVSLSKNYKA